MASPSNMPPWPGVTEPLSFPGPHSTAPQQENILDLDLILSRLRDQIAAGTQDPDALLGAIAIAAQALTDATGAALGMRRDGTVSCVGRSGETAPALGARLSENAGISGACLRSGRIQRCDDTETDLRVDAEVCRHLGLGSIAAVPIRSRLETVGILEVFSTSARAFTDDHLAHLSSLAELADAASARINGHAAAPESASPGVEANPTPDLPVLSSPPIRKNVLRKPVWRYFATAGGVALLGFFSFASWRMWTELKSRNESKPPVAQSPAPVAAGAENQFANAPLVIPKPTPEQIAPPDASKKGAHQGGVVQAASVEAELDDGLIRSISTDSSTPAKVASPLGNSNTKPTEKDASANTPPQVAMVTSPDQSLHGILVGNTALPRLSPPVSQGVVPLVLEHKVIPTYPSDARTMRLAGTVVLRAIVSEEGRISQVEPVSGEPILARAAMEAVRQWRYRPALLNGKPTPIETNITLNFKLP